MHTWNGSYSEVHCPWYAVSVATRWYEAAVLLKEVAFSGDKVNIHGGWVGQSKNAILKKKKIIIIASAPSFYSLSPLFLSPHTCIFTLLQPIFSFICSSSFSLPPPSDKPEQVRTSPEGEPGSQTGRMQGLFSNKVKLFFDLFFNRWRNWGRISLSLSSHLQNI